MITETRAIRRDPEMCCGHCGSPNVWQSRSLRACEDMWHCNNCGTDAEPDACGPTGGMYPLSDGRFISRCEWLGQVQI